MEERGKLGEEKAEASPAQDTAVAKGPRTADHRIERLRDLYAAAVEEPDPFRATIRAATADLLEINYRLGAAIKAAMRSGTMSLEAYKDSVMPAIDKLGVLHRQVMRSVQLDQDWMSEQEPSGGANRRRLTRGGKVGETGI